MKQYSSTGPTRRTPSLRAGLELLEGRWLPSFSPTASYPVSGSAMLAADSDFVAKSGTLVFAPGQTSKSIPVVVKGEKKRESNETFFVNLTNATNVGSQGIGEILDDDTPQKHGKR